MPWLLCGGPLLRQLSKITTLAAKVLWKVGDRFSFGRAGSADGDLESTRRDNFRAHLKDDWLELFQSRDSITASIIRPEKLAVLIEQGMAGNRRSSEFLANMVVAEEFFRLARQIERQV